MSTTVTDVYTGTPALGTAIFVQVLDPATGTALLARTNGGIREDKPGVYAFSTSLADHNAYEIIWDENDGFYAATMYVPKPAVTVNITEGSPLPLTADANADLLGKTFLIKRGDTKPYLRRQLVDTNGNTIPMTGSETVMFTMRISSDITMAGTAKVHAAATIVDATTSTVEYRWQTGDTDTSTFASSDNATFPSSGAEVPYAGEFEVTFTDGSIETFPQGDYIRISIPRDLDPGINP